MSGVDERPVACVLLTGDELLEGRVRDTNGPYLAASLARHGFAVRGVITVPDDEPTIVATLRWILSAAPRILVVSGGLGTTHDDLTMAAVAAATGRPLERRDEAWRPVERRVQEVAERRGLDPAALSAQAERLAWLPQGAVCLAPAGMAPGIELHLDGTTIVVLPGVPRELEAMWPAVLDRITEVRSPRVRLLRLHGIGETQVGPVLEQMPHDGVRVGITAGEGEVVVRLAAIDEQAVARADALAEAIDRALPVYSHDGRTVDELVAEGLRQRGATLAVAESCTGGMLGARLTERPGSSAYFLGGVISYADDVKHEVLGVGRSDLEAHGAVSPAVATAMAEGACRLTGADYGLAITGVAGPGGGSADKPVGLVYIAAAAPDHTVVDAQRFFGERDLVRRQSVATAMHALLALLEERR